MSAEPERPTDAGDHVRRLNRVNKLKNRALKMGLTIHDFYAVMDSPPRCEACGVQTTTGEKSTGTDVVFDHSHKTGVFRGILCRRCNMVLGQVEDDPERLRGLAAYLDRFGT